MSATTTRCATTAHFRELAARSRKAPSDDLLDKLDPDGTHIVWMSFPHNDQDVRAAWMCKFEGRDESVQLLMDMSFEDFNALPTVELPA